MGEIADSRSGPGSVADNRRTSCHTRKQGSSQGLQELWQKDPGSNPYSLLLAKGRTLHINKEHINRVEVYGSLMIP